VEHGEDGSSDGGDGREVDVAADCLGGAGADGGGCALLVRQHLAMCPGRLHRTRCTLLVH